MEFKTNQDIYDFAQGLMIKYSENGDLQVSQAIFNALNTGMTASEQLGELKIVFEKIKSGWGDPSLDLITDLGQAIEAINKAFRRKR